MFGNNPLSTVTFGGEKILGQGFDPLDPSSEIKIFVPGDTESGDMGPTEGIQEGFGDPEESYGESFNSGDYDSSY